MKILNLSILLFLAFVTFNLCAQTPKQIEDDLLKSFKRIDYYRQQNDGDKIAIANDEFEKKLKIYTEKFPSTLTYSFDALMKEHMDISSSTDGSFRIYSWDTGTGGTMRAFENVFQYGSEGKTTSIIDVPKQEGDYINNYHKMYTFKANGHTYYLTIYLVIGSTKDVGDGIRIFLIENGKLGDAKLIKTHSGLRSDLFYDYDFASVVNIDFDKRPAIRFEDKTNTIYLPLVDGNRNMTNKFILYKFTGQYFERVKN